MMQYSSKPFRIWAAAESTRAWYHRLPCNTRPRGRRHWPSANDEIVLTRSFSGLNNVTVGDRIEVVSVPQEPMLAVVGEVVDIDVGSADLSSQHGWVLKAAVPTLTAKDSSFYLMDYRFATDPTSS